MAELFPRQGHWSEGEYLSLPTNRLIELSNGKLEVLHPPTQSHQLILLSLFRKIHDFVIADPRNATITIFKLESVGEPYAEVGVYKPGEFATSVLLKGLTVEVAAVFEAANE